MDGGERTENEMTEDELLTLLDRAAGYRQILHEILFDLSTTDATQLLPSKDEPQFYGRSQNDLTALGERLHGR